MNITRVAAYFVAVTALSFVIVTQTRPDSFALLRARFLQQIEFPTPAESYHAIALSQGVYSYGEPGEYTGPEVDVQYVKVADYSTEVAVTTSKDGGSQIVPLPDDVIGVVFRGSEETDDWVVDFDFQLVPCLVPGCPADARVHNGFQDSLYDNENIIYEVEDAVKSILEGTEFQGDKSQIYVAGHSLGGALAQMCATHIASNNPDINVKMINFGAPRVGNRAFAEFHNSLPNLSAWRYVNDFDTIPRTPLNTQGYLHAGNLLDMKRSDCKAYYNQVGDDELGYAGAYNRWYYLGLNPTDHFVANYRRILLNKQDEPDWWAAQFEM